MKRNSTIARSAVCVLILANSSIAGERDKLSPADRKFFDGQDVLAVRGWGTLLEATAGLEVSREGKSVVIKWSLDYDGPRPPLIILKPSLIGTGGQTRAIVFAYGADGVRRRLDKFLSGGGMMGPPEHFFVRIDKGKKATGKLEIQLSVIKSGLQKKWPEVFQNCPSVLYLQLEHSPTDRGKNSQDAWTGNLWSKVLELKVDNW